eukprot:3379074-Pyramimonas_sp.AAC.1
MTDTSPPQPLGAPFGPPSDPLWGPATFLAGADCRACCSRGLSCSERHQDRQPDDAPAARHLLQPPSARRPHRRRGKE